MSGAEELFNRAIDVTQRPMRKTRARSATMSVLVVADKIDVHDRQAARDIDVATDGDEFAQPCADKNPRQHHEDLQPKCLAPPHTIDEIPESAKRFDDQLAG